MSSRTITKQITKILTQQGVIIKSLNLRTSPNILGDFSLALENAINENEYGPFVSPQSVTVLRDTKATVFLSRDKMAGVAIWPDGNIGALFPHYSSKIRPARPELLLTALAYGGCKLDCFNGKLARFYGDAGFIPVARVAFDPQFAPDNWKPEWGSPDIIFWIHNGEDPLTVAKNYGHYPYVTADQLNNLPLLPSYEDAYQFRDDRLLSRI